MHGPTDEIGRDDIPDYQERPATLSATYLSEAVEAFSLTNDPPTLYSYLHGQRDLDQTGRALAQIEAGRVRVKCSMRAVLFAALAAESYINEFLAARFSGQDRDALDGLPTVSKYVLGFRIGSKDLFKRDKWPTPVLNELFKFRNRLVHPKPGFGPEPELGPLGPFEEQLASRQVADYLIAVACAGFVVVKETYGPDHLDLWTDLIWFGRDVIDEFVSEAGKLPPLDGPPSISLGRRLIEARSKPRGT